MESDQSDITPIVAKLVAGGWAEHIERTWTAIDRSLRGRLDDPETVDAVTGFLRMRGAEMTQRLTTGEPLDRAFLRRVAREAAEAHLPRVEIQSSLGVALSADWEFIVANARHLNIDDGDLIRASGLLWSFSRDVDAAIAEEYAAVGAREAAQRTEQRDRLVEALLTDTLPNRPTIASALTHLGLPAHSPLCVVAIRTAVPAQAMSDVRTRITARGLPSSWRSDIDTLTGIVGLKTPGAVDTLTDALKSVAGIRVGMSGPADSLELPHAYRRADLALSITSTERPFAVLGDDAARTAVAAAPPSIMRTMAEVTLSGLNGVASPFREELLETFLAWVDNGGSVESTADSMYLHPNTIRYRLRRLETATNRSIRDPRAVTDLILAARTSTMLAGSGPADGT